MATARDYALSGRYTLCRTIGGMWDDPPEYERLGDYASAAEAVRAARERVRAIHALANCGKRLVVVDLDGDEWSPQDFCEIYAESLS